MDLFAKFCPLLTNHSFSESLHFPSVSCIYKILQVQKTEEIGSVFTCECRKVRQCVIWITNVHDLVKHRDLSCAQLSAGSAVLVFCAMSAVLGCVVLLRLGLSKAFTVLQRRPADLSSCLSLKYAKASLSSLFYFSRFKIHGEIKSPSPPSLTEWSCWITLWN